MPIISSPAYKTPTPGYQSSLPPPGVTSPLKTPYELVQAQSRILRYPWATYLAFEELISTFNSWTELQKHVDQGQQQTWLLKKQRQETQHLQTWSTLLWVADGLFEVQAVVQLAKRLSSHRCK